VNEISYLPHKEVDFLYECVEDNLEWYFTGEGESPIRKGTRIRKAQLPGSVQSLGGALESGSANDPENARKVFMAIRELTRHQAADPRLWVRLCHGECVEYVRKRWLKPEDPRVKRIQAVRNHFFARSSRAIFRDNGLSRLWWLGRVAEDVKVFGADPDLFLEILLHRQDIRSAVLERPSTTSNPRVLFGLYEVMRRHWKGEDQNLGLFQRDVFRAWMKAMDREGGVRLLDAMTDENLVSLATDQLARIFEKNPRLDRTALARSQQAAGASRHANGR